MDQTALLLLVLLTPVGIGLWLLLMWLPLKLWGVENVKEILDEITLPEAVLLGLWANAAASLVESLLSRFV